MYHVHLINKMEEWVSEKWAFRVRTLCLWRTTTFRAQADHLHSFVRSFFVLQASYPVWKSIVGKSDKKPNRLFNVGCQSFYSKTITITELFPWYLIFFVVVVVNSVLIRLLANSKTVLSIVSTFFFSRSLALSYDLIIIVVKSSRTTPNKNDERVEVTSSIFDCWFLTYFSVLSASHSKILSAYVRAHSFTRFHFISFCWNLISFTRLLFSSGPWCRYATHWSIFNWNQTYIYILGSLGVLVSSALHNILWHVIVHMLSALSKQLAGRERETERARELLHDLNWINIV